MENERRNEGPEAALDRLLGAKEKTDGELSSVVEKTLSGETAAEHILPDYMGEIRKVLACRARAVPGGEYAEADRLTAAGSVEYSLLYLDGENKLTEACFSSDYEIACPLEGGEGFVRKTSVGGVNLRLTGPRKMQVKAPVSVLFCVTKAPAERPEGIDASGIEVRKTEISARKCAAGKSGEREYAEEATFLDGVTPEDVEIVAAGGFVTVEDSKAAPEGVILRGTLDLSAIVRIAGEPPFSVGKRIPFEELIPLDEKDLSPTTAGGELTSVRCLASERDGGAALTFSAIAEYRAAGEKNTPVSLPVDAYSTKAPSETFYETKNYNEFSGFERKIFDLVFETDEKTAGLTDGESVRDVLGTFADERVDAVEILMKENAVRVSGKISFLSIVLTESGEGTLGYASPKASFDYSETVRFSQPIGEGVTARALVHAIRPECAFDGGRVTFRTVLTVEILLLSERSVNALAGISVSDEEFPARKASEIKVVFPSTGETLWSVAKRCHTTREAIAGRNGLSESCFADGQDSLGGVKKLLIPG